MKRQFTRFAIVGGINTAITLVLYWGLLFVLDHNWSYGLTFVAGVLISWTLNSKKTFETDLDIKKLPTYGLFYLGSYWVGQLVLNWSISTLGMNEHIAIFGVILISLPINFIGSRFILVRGVEVKAPPLSDEDITCLVKLHMDSLPTSITARLGRGVTESFYRFVMDSDQEIVTVVRDETGQVLGCALVSEDPEGLNGRLKFDFEFLFYVGLNFYRVPLSTFLGGDKKETGFTPELVYLFTDVLARSKGLGKKLLEQLEKELKSKQIETYFVKTLQDDDNRAIGFYQRNGFEICGEDTQYGHHYVVFRKNL